MEYYEFDSEKAFKEASEPSRRTFFKKIGAVVAGAVAGDRILGKTVEKPVRIPDPPDPIRKEMEYQYHFATTAAYPTAYMTTDSISLSTDPYWYIKNKP